jgi:hypothetical protein
VFLYARKFTFRSFRAPSWPDAPGHALESQVGCEQDRLILPFFGIEETVGKPETVSLVYRAARGQLIHMATRTIIE